MANRKQEFLRAFLETTTARGCDAADTIAELERRGANNEVIETIQRQLANTAPAPGA